MGRGGPEGLAVTVSMSLSFLEIMMQISASCGISIAGEFGIAMQMHSFAYEYSFLLVIACLSFLFRDSEPLIEHLYCLFA